ncbi:hypothetical protein VKT23_009566 [Stygiomarasmius scandens]|uniref:4-hydroxybenzoate polyprenyltransferase, mitochondrial n=1 Tax=Marasmiellus scandens TaxID=2682957 RepID=A0ABR1JE28_9AGAR
MKIQEAHSPMWHMYFQLTRLHKFPVGSILIFWPCVWSLTMVAFEVNMNASTYLFQVVLFGIGSTLLHSAACVINDICDRDIDGQVERTRNRPLVTNAIPLIGAYILLSVLTASSIIMLFFTNTMAILYGLFAVFPLHALYPLMKRWTWWPQAWLGFAMNWGIFVAWISVTGESPPSHITIFFFGTVCWTIVYDTIYACQDKTDDAKVGVKSTALLFGSHVRPILLFFAVSFLACMSYAGICNNQGLPFFLVSCGGAAVHFLWQFTTWEVDNPNDSGAKFVANGNMGYIVWAGLLIDYLRN